jgi:hypothetical protein
MVIEDAYEPNSPQCNKRNPNPGRHTGRPLSNVAPIITQLSWKTVAKKLETPETAFLGKKEQSFSYSSHHDDAARSSSPMRRTQSPLSTN